MLGPEERAAMAALQRKIGLNSYAAVVLAADLARRGRPGTPQRRAFERIASALDVFDFASAASALERFMDEDNPDGVHDD